jgi:hypothetical protein
MLRLEIEAALDAAFKQCEVVSCPLSDQQKQILLQTMQELAQNSSKANSEVNDADGDFDEKGSGAENPLNNLTLEEREALLAFIKQEESENRPWKTTLLNDWVQERDSGTVQFIRDRYGVQWLEQVKPFHLAQYEGAEPGQVMQLKVGDRIEVTNGLWEWVQEDGPCSREWFPCTVIKICQPEGAEVEHQPEEEAEGTDLSNVSCIVRFDTGAEYEIQGVYDWNRPNWRWLEGS